MTRDLSDQNERAARARAEDAASLRIVQLSRKPILGRWPYLSTDSRWLPPTLPSGRDWPPISVITPSFNQGAFVEETILSVINQGYPNLEYIMVDGNSEDDSLKIFERYHASFAHLIVEKDDGQSHAINKGMGLASGEILTWLNADDMLAPDALFAAALAFDYSDADMIAGVCEIRKSDVTLGYHLTSCENGLLPLEELMDLDRCWNGGRFFYQPEVMFKKALWDRAGAHVRQDLYYSMDYELWVRFAKTRARLHVVGRPICIFRKHDQQKTHEEGDFKRELRRVRDGYSKRTDYPDIGGRGDSPGRPNLRVVLLNDLGFQYGAGIAQRRIAEAIAWAGHEFESLSLVEMAQNPAAQSGELGQEVSASVERFNPDMIVVGNLHAARGDPRLIERLARRWPVFVVLHDFWWLTGRCAYMHDCLKYLNGCDATCPTPHEYPQLESHKIAEAWRTKRAVLDARSQLVLLGNSRWTAEFARTALTEGAGRLSAPPRVEEIRIGVPTDVFRPRDMHACRKKFDLPLDKFVIMISASTVGDQRKGAKDYARALEVLNLADTITVAVGRSDAASDLRIPNLHRIEYVSSEDDLAVLYGAADIFVGPSSAETFGQVFVEAAACGTPVVAYDAAGMKDSVATAITGLKAATGNVGELAACILQLYRNPDLRRSMRFWARHYAENEYSLMRSYHSFFEVLRRTNLLECLTMKEKIAFQPERVRLSVAGSTNGGAARALQMRIAKLEKIIARQSKKMQKSPILYALRTKYPRLAHAFKKVKGT